MPKTLKISFNTFTSFKLHMSLSVVKLKFKGDKWFSRVIHLRKGIRFECRLNPSS